MVNSRHTTTVLQLTDLSSSLSKWLALSSVLLSSAIALPLLAEGNVDPPNDGPRPVFKLNAPYIISPPSDSDVMTLNPRFQWAEVSGVESYNVSLINNEEGIVIWSDDISEDELQFNSGSIPIPAGMAYGTEYVLRVIAPSSSSSNVDDSQETIFTVLTEEESGVVRNQLEEIESSANQGEPAMVLNQKVEYLLTNESHNLTSDAFDLLDAEMKDEDSPIRLFASCKAEELMERTPTIIISEEDYRRAFQEYRIENNLGDCPESF